MSPGQDPIISFVPPRTPSATTEPQTDDDRGQAHHPPEQQRKYYNPHIDPGIGQWLRGDQL